MDHWFIDALAELVNEADGALTANVLVGLSTVIEVFCVESNFDEEQTRAIRELIARDSVQCRRVDRIKTTSELSLPQRLHS